MNRTRLRTGWALAVALGLAWVCGMARADGLQAAGTGERAWVAVPWRDGPDGWRVELLHGQIGSTDGSERGLLTGADGAVGTVRRASKLQGRPMPAGLAAQGDRAVLMFRSGTVLAIDAERQESTGLWRYERVVLPSLPSDGRAVAATLSDERLWVLLRRRAGEDASSTATSGETGTPSESASERSGPTGRRLDDPRVRRAIGLPVLPGTVRPDKDAEQTGNEPAGSTDDGSAPSGEAQPEAIDAAAGEPAGRDGLWVLSRGEWESVPLPEGWPDAIGGAALAPDGDGSGGVWLVGEASAGAWRVWGGSMADPILEGASHSGVSWSAADDASGWALRGDAVRAARVGRQPVALMQRGTELVAWALRSGGLTRLGTLPIGVGEEEAWGVVGASNAAWAVIGPVAEAGEGSEGSTAAAARAAREEVDGLRAGGLTLDGRRTETGPVTLVTQPLLPGSPGMVVEAAVLIASVSMIVWYWRRDPQRRTPRLGEGVAIGSLSQRLGAVMVDVLPVFGLGCLVWQMTPTELLAHWPGSSNTSPDWWGLLPGGSVIVAVIVHTTIAEAMTGRSLGKRVMGLRVVTLDGSTPTRGQVVTRGVLRCMELIAWLLALVPVLGPYRQRLGDLVAGTVVIVDHPDATAEPPADDDEDDGSEDRGTRVDRRA